MEERDDYPLTVTYSQYVEMEKELASLKEDFIRIRDDRDSIWQKYEELKNSVGNALITDGGVMHPLVYKYLLDLIQKP